MTTSSRTKYDVQLEQLETLENKKRNSARTDLSKFVRFTFDGYDMQEFHQTICDYLDKLSNREIRKLMIFVPPQHGKTTLSSINFPALLLGKDPTEKIIIGSYNQTKASEFLTDCKKVIKSEPYKELFPNTKIEGKDKDTFFEVNKKGFVKAAGMDSGVTGTSATCIIIDDPFKGRNTANSETIRNRAWGSYFDDFQTRLSDDTGIMLMLFTRWHEDDIAGRIIDPNNKYYDEQEAKEWTVIVFQGLKEETKPYSCALDIKDKRKIGDALWEAKHGKKKLEKIKRINPTTYASLYQQRPNPVGGDMIKEEWFKVLQPNELPFNIDSVTWDAWIDGAWTKKKSNDETAISWTYFDKSNKMLYIRGIYGVRKELDRLMKFLPSNADANGATSKTKFHIEMKASGAAIKVLLHKEGFNTVRINNDHVRLGKYNRVEQCEPFLAGGRVVLVQGSWIPSFIAQCTAFPNGAHDDKVDVLTYPILNYLIKGKRRAKTTLR